MPIISYMALSKVKVLELHLNKRKWNVKQTNKQKKGWIM